METESSSSRVQFCRLCGGDFYAETLSLFPTPLANELYESLESALAAETFRLTLAMCKRCSHIQLDEAVGSARLFDSYVYTSSTSHSFQAHFDELALKIQGLLPPLASILEVGSNDGYLLSRLNDFELHCLGLEPSEILVAKSRMLGLEIHHGYLEESFVSEIVESRGQFDCVVGNNVFAHIPNLAQAFKHVNTLLKPNGLFVIEVAHAVEILRKGIFDTIYHEHHSYHTLLAIRPFLESLGFGLVDVEVIETHGGSLRIVAQKGGKTNPSKVSAIEDEERNLGFDSPKLFEKLAKLIDTAQSSFASVIASSGQSIVFGYAAPAKVVTFLYQVSAKTHEISFIVDDNPLKQGKFLPGLGIPIVDSEFLKGELSQRSKLTFVCLVFAWNLSHELRAKIRGLLPKGSEIVTFFPTLSKEVIE